jgi:hypothetical protein
LGITGFVGCRVSLKALTFRFHKEIDMSSKHRIVTRFGYAIGLGLIVFAASAGATDHQALAKGSSYVDPGLAQATRVHLARGLAASSSGTAKAKELIPNTYRAYPASCFSDTLPATPSGLPDTPSGPIVSQTVTLYATDGKTANSAEDVTVTVWRVACSSSGDKLAYVPDGGPVSATLVRIQRQSQYDHETSLFPTFPAISIAQGTVAFDDPNGLDLVRVATDPNTVTSDTPIKAPIIDSTTYVLENYPSTDAGFFDFNVGFKIRFDNGIENISGQTGQYVLTVPDYVPTQATYPAAFTSLPINGYLTGSWFDPAHGGEGILTEVIDTGDAKTRLFVATWYTFDSTGLPYWLVASGGFNIGDTQVQNMQVTYRTGGGFAGNFSGTLPQPVWGTMNVQFPNCNTMNFSFASSGSANGAPVGSGTRTWSRIGGINSLACE